MAEPGRSVGVRREGLQHFDSACPLELHVEGAVNQAHGPLADEFLDLVLA
jgi:hypothetical protein